MIFDDENDDEPYVFCAIDSSVFKQQQQQHLPFSI